MDKKTLFALTAKVFNTLKGIGIKPKIGVTTGIKRLPGTKNSFNTDLSKLEGGDPEGLKRLIANDANFLPQASADEIAQFNDNLEYLKSTFPDTFSKPQIVEEAKTGIKTVVDDVDPKSRKLTREEIEDYEAELGDAETWLSEGTVEEAEKALQRSKAEEAYYRGQYKAGKLDPTSGEESQSRLNFLRKKSEEAEMAGDKRLFTFDEMEELDRLESSFKKPEISEAEMIKQKYGNLIDDNLLKQILIDNNPQRKAEVMATIDEALKMQEKGMSQQEIIDIIKNTTRTKQAKGGLIKSITQKSMMSNLDRTLSKGLGTMFKRKR